MRIFRMHTTIEYSNHIQSFDFVLAAWHWLIKSFRLKLQFIGKLADKNKWFLLLLIVFLPLCVCLLPFDLIVWICRKIKRLILLLFERLFHKKLFFKKINRLEGIGYLIFALILTLLLIPLGSGPEGSEVKSNVRNSHKHE